MSAPPATGARARALRTLALQLLVELDARGGLEREEAADRLGAIARMNAEGEDEPGDTLSDEEEARVLDLALGAWSGRRRADEEIRELAEGWPAHRQPAVDRALLRLAHHEMTSGVTPPKVAVNEAVELAKRFSTERSPAFVNGVLDKVLRRVLAEGRAPAEGA